MNVVDIVLLIAEQAELPTVSAMMRSNSRMYATISGHERSICKTLIKGYQLQPTGDVVSTRTTEPEVLPRYSLDALGELERRQQRISLVVKDVILSHNKNITDEWRPRYVAGMERALHQCDHIVDLGIRDDEREAQVDYIKTLQAIDLAFLFEAAWIGSIGWARSMGDAMATDAEQLPKMLAFEELILRKGSKFLWGYALGPAKFRKEAEREIKEASAEIYQWEFGQGRMLPSLRLAVIHAFMEEKKCAFGDFHELMTAAVVGKSKGPLAAAKGKDEPEESEE